MPSVPVPRSVPRNSLGSGSGAGPLGVWWAMISMSRNRPALPSLRSWWPPPHRSRLWMRRQFGSNNMQRGSGSGSVPAALCHQGVAGPPHITADPPQSRASVAVRHSVRTERRGGERAVDVSDSRSGARACPGRSRVASRSARPRLGAAVEAGATLQEALRTDSAAARVRAARVLLELGIKVTDGDLASRTAPGHPLPRPRQHRHNEPRLVLRSVEDTRPPLEDWSDGPQRSSVIRG
jgi:hypothetical protein